ncbi:MAG TPA: SGNH/GDSL hydrolase family protein [Longimicrobium sp.]|nr:SGNH/GDSL hydrolase family protein [Longimicrobium sp.]
MSETRGTVVLLGDSIFDNAAYTRGGPHVAEQLQDALPDGWRAVLAAVDGAVTADVSSQLRGLPDGATHLVVSSGGNDALGHTSLLSDPASSSPQVLGRLATIGAGFEDGYRAMLREVLALRLPTVLCTIYNGNMEDELTQRLAQTGLTVFNDVILRVAFEHGLPVIDLRAVCGEPEDYANPIEPSSHGGEKIARAIVRAVTEHDFARRRTEVFV